MSNSLKLPSAAISNHKGIQVRSRILHFHDLAPFFAFVPRISLNGIPCPSISTKWFIRPRVERKRKPRLNIAYFFVSSVREYSAAAIVKAGVRPDAFNPSAGFQPQNNWTGSHWLVLRLIDSSKLVSLLSFWCIGVVLWLSAMICQLCVVCSFDFCSVGQGSVMSGVSGCLWNILNLSFLLRHLFCLSLSISLCAKTFSLSLHK